MFYQGRHKRSAVSHSIHKTTLAVNPELKECARRPQPATQLFCGNTVKTEISIVELSLLLKSKSYHHIYKMKTFEGVKIIVCGSGQQRFGCTSDQNRFKKKKKKIRCKNKSTLTPINHKTNRDSF